MIRLNGKKKNNSTSQQPFTMISHNFLDNPNLNVYQKMVFIALKRFADDKNQCYPSIAKLSDITQISPRKIQMILRELAQKHLISITDRSRLDGGYSSNLYTLYDDKIKKKELVSNADQSTLTSTQALKHIHKPTKDDIINQPKSQAAAERYTLDSLKKLYDYSTLIADYPHYQEHINTALNIIYDTLNTSKATIRIGTDDKPTMVVSSRLLKLDPSDLIYAIERFNQQSERIKNVKGYLLTILYTAKEQAHLDRLNLGHHNGDF